MIKRCFALLIVLIVAAMSVTVASAAVELEIDTPYGIIYKVSGENNSSERVSISCIFSDEFAALTSADNEENMTKYGIINATAYVQVDYCIDGGDWHEEQVWGTTPTEAPYVGNVTPGDTVKHLDLLYLLNDYDIENAGALAVKDENGRYVFDLDNHTLEFKLRIALLYTKDGRMQVTTSEWSEAIKVERDKDFGEAPTELDVPIVNAPVVAYQENQMPYLTFFVRTPESIKEAEAWLFTQEPATVSLQIEIDKGDGSWQSVNYSSNGNYVNETKAIYLDVPDVADASTMKVRAMYVAYLKDKTLTSDYSEVLEFSVPRWEEGKGIMHAKCQFCGICRPIFGKCMFVVGGIVLLVAVIAAVPVKMMIDRAKVKKAEAEKERQRKIKEEREAYDKLKKDKKNKNKKG